MRNKTIRLLMLFIAFLYSIPATGEEFATARPISPVLTPSHEIKAMLYSGVFNINMEVINRAMMALACAEKYNIAHNNTLTLIDYSLPSNKKRLWVFNLRTNRLLFHTYVSHGIKSGTLLSRYFSNKVNGKTSSIGVYNTEKAYYGRHGLSLKLQGLDRGFNSNAYRRYVVIHGSWYVNKSFIEKYGRPGRSWGCPSLPLHLTKPIINSIKDRTLLVIYYPKHDWLLKSKFLNCNAVAKKNLFSDKNNNSKREEHEPIVAIKAEIYQTVFNKKIPLNRMLRRQINRTEYIALTPLEFKKISLGKGTEKLNTLYFVIPVVKELRGYYATEMKIIGIVKPNRVTTLRSTKRFIRWLGL